jgi:hypothetical protein
MGGEVRDRDVVVARAKGGHVEASGGDERGDGAFVDGRTGMNGGGQSG